MMTFGDLSGQINGLIIFSSLSFVLIQFMQGRQRDHKGKIGDMVKTLGRIVSKDFPGNQKIKQRLDLLSAKRLGTFGGELATLYSIILSVCVVKVIDTSCNAINNNGFHHHILVGISAISGVFLTWLMFSGLHTIYVRTITHRHEAAVRRFHRGLRLINPLIDDEIDARPRF